MAKRIPAYRYTGVSRVEADEDYWYIYLTSPGKGKLTMEFDKKVDVFFVGGGGAGGSGNGAGGGGGGYVKTVSDTLEAGKEYVFSIGEGGIPAVWSSGGDGESTYVLGTVTGVDAEGNETIAYKYGVEGGKGGNYSKKIVGDNKYDQDCPGGDGGSGGGAGTYTKGKDGGAGGSSGMPGGRTDAVGGTGSGVRSWAFAESAYPLYGGGGGGSSRNMAGGAGGAGGGGIGGSEDASGYEKDGGNGADNTGGGGGGASYNGLGGYGGSGVVIIRGTELDFLPVFFDGTRVQQIFYNGQEVRALTFNGVQLFSEGD